MSRNLLKESISFVPWPLRRIIKRLPLIAPLQRFFVARFLEGREFVHTVDAGPAKGLRYPILLPQDKGIWTGTYELDLALRIAEAVYPGNVCFDIGGWHGFFSGVMALAGARRVIIFEPLPSNCARIRQMIELNSQLPIELLTVAVGDKEGTANFCVMPDSSMGKLASSGFQKERASNTVVQVPVVALDRLLADGLIEPCSVMKIDVEGAELFVLRGARQLLSTYTPKLFIEIHSEQLGTECRSFLTELGFTVDYLEPPQMSPHREISHLIALPRGNAEPKPKAVESQ